MGLMDWFKGGSKLAALGPIIAPTEEMMYAYADIAGVKGIRAQLLAQADRLGDPLGEGVARQIFLVAERGADSKKALAELTQELGQKPLVLSRGDLIAQHQQMFRGGKDLDAGMKDRNINLDVDRCIAAAMRDGSVAKNRHIVVQIEPDDPRRIQNIAYLVSEFGTGPQGFGPHPELRVVLAPPNQAQLQHLEQHLKGCRQVLAEHTPQLALGAKEGYRGPALPEWPDTPASDASAIEGKKTSQAKATAKPAQEPDAPKFPDFKPYQPNTDPIAALVKNEARSALPLPGTPASTGPHYFTRVSIVPMQGGVFYNTKTSAENYGQLLKTALGPPEGQPPGQPAGAHRPVPAHRGDTRGSPAEALLAVRREPVPPQMLVNQLGALDDLRMGFQSVFQKKSADSAVLPKGLQSALDSMTQDLHQRIGQSLHAINLLHGRTEITGARALAAQLVMPLVRDNWSNYCSDDLLRLPNANPQTAREFVKRKEPAHIAHVGQALAQAALDNSPGLYQDKEGPAAQAMTKLAVAVLGLTAEKTSKSEAALEYLERRCGGKEGAVALSAKLAAQFVTTCLEAKIVDPPLEQQGATTSNQPTPSPGVTKSGEDRGDLPQLPYHSLKVVFARSADRPMEVAIVPKTELIQQRRQGPSREDEYSMHEGNQPAYLATVKARDPGKGR